MHRGLLSMHRGLGLGGAKERLLQRTLCVSNCTFVLVQQVN
jgi:hypothetical protein